VQGAALVVSAAYGSILIRKRYYGLPFDEYGWLFLPEFVTVVATALLASRVTRRLSTTLAYRLGLGCQLVAMILLVVGAVVNGTPPAEYSLILTADAFIGAGFGLGFPSLLSYGRILHPESPGSSVLVLNALLAAGLAAAPVLASAFVHIRLWWGLPVLLAVLVVVLLALSPGLPRTRAYDAAVQPFNPRIPGELKIYGILVVVYSFCVIMCTIWSQLNPARPEHSPFPSRVLAVGAFWAALVMAGRVLFATLDQRRAPPLADLVPFAVLSLAVVLGAITNNKPVERGDAFVLAAFACAALLPLRTTAGEERADVVALGFAGGVAVLYQLEVGFSGVALGTLLHHGLSLLTIFSSVAALGVVACLAAGRVHALSPATTRGATYARKH
jgi:MFS family permease